MNLGEASAALDAKGVQWLCDEIIDGKSLREIAAGLGMNHATVIRWVGADDDRAKQVREARITSAQTFDEMALTGILGAKTKIALARAKEAAHHYRWRASKIDPRTYGDKVQTEVSGPDGGPLKFQQVRRTVIDPTA